ncbi:protein Niban 1a isoform X1 [Oryzias melastigma]|uniref:Niban apoptosis regulator 1a n=2 Tax=Oryzias melastigma TaxID=30732 RepID=A0A3B3DN63_ORYME|nr:protein Niban 1a isoform X1 [Oryzias melastigma]
MGISASSLLDEAKSNYIRDQVEAELREFGPYYRKQFSVAWFNKVEDDLEQNKQKITQLLKQRAAPEDSKVLYEEGILYFDDSRKWKERYVVVRANYSLECHDSLESFLKGAPPCHKLLPTGGTVLTTEEMYMAMVDKCFPGDSNVKEDFAPPLSGMPGQFPVYLRLPYRRDSYFCFRQQAKQATFISILSDCIRHQNQDFLKKKTCEVQAFLKAIQLYRQDKDKYEAWDMLIGSDVRVMANQVMEQLLPSLEKDMLPRLKAKKSEKKRVWFVTLEAAYILVQEHLLEKLSEMKEECRVSVRKQEVLIHSDMDQILNSRRQLEEKIRAKVSEPAEKLCSESIQPYLGSVLEELMKPISLGFLEGRQLMETMMDQVCRNALECEADEQIKKALNSMSRPNLVNCYLKIASLEDALHQLKERFGFSNVKGMIQSAQIDLQQLMQNAAYTFELLLNDVVKGHSNDAGTTVEKAKHRVLKQFDYDSSTVRQRIFQDALVSITLPVIKRNLAPTCKEELQGLEQTIYSDYADFVHVENVYEKILLQILDAEASKVVKEAVDLKKHNLLTESDLARQFSRSSLSSSPSSTPNSPELTQSSGKQATPPSPLAVNGLPPSPQKKVQQEVLLREAAQAPSEKVELTKELAAGQEKEAESLTKDGKTDELQTSTSVETPQTETQNLKAEISAPTKDPPTAAEQENHDCQEPKLLPAASDETMTQRESSNAKLEAPPSGTAAEDVALQLQVEKSESGAISDPNSLDVSVGSESTRSDPESTDDVSTTSDTLEATDPHAKAEAEVAPSQTPEEEVSGDVEVKDSSETSADVKATTTSDLSEVAEPPAPSQAEVSVVSENIIKVDDTSPTDAKAPALDSVKEIRNLVMEVIEVEQPVHLYPNPSAQEE